MTTEGSETGMGIGTGTATGIATSGTRPRISVSMIEIGIAIEIGTEGTSGERVNELAPWRLSENEPVLAHWSSNVKGLATGTPIQEGIHPPVITDMVALPMDTGAMAEDPPGT